MIRLIIVEDEQVIRSGIERHLPWVELGVDEVRTAANAEEALDICTNFRPDIILSDIRMPGMNGIELCTRFREKLPHSQILFISGFSDKEYLMAAIRLGAVSYVEKPILVPELSKAVAKAVAEVRRQDRQERDMVHYLLRSCEEGSEKMAEALKLFAQGQQIQNDTCFCICLLRVRAGFGNPQALTRSCQQEISRADGDCGLHLAVDAVSEVTLVLLLSAARPFAERIPALSQTLLDVFGREGDCFLGWGVLVDSLTGLLDSYRAASLALQCLAYKDWGHYALSSEPRGEYMEKPNPADLDKFYRDLLDSESDVALKGLEGMYRWLVESHMVLNFNIRNLYFQFDTRISQAQRGLPTHGRGPNPGFVDSAQTIREMHEYVSGRAAACCREERQSQKNSNAVQTVLDHLDRHFSDQSLSIQQLADLVYLSPTYLSGIFKKQVGETIGQYLTRLRVEKAKIYLADPQYRLYQVAEMVGYEDANYFGKLFKKQTGMLPSEYRESKRL